MSIDISNRKLDSYSFEDYSNFEPEFKCEIIWGKVIMTQLQSIIFMRNLV